jgi:hypothetical protein
LISARKKAYIFVTVYRFRVQRSAPPLTAETASLIEKETPALRSHIRWLRSTKKGLKTRNRRQKHSFSQVIAKLAPNFGLGLMKLTLSLKIRTPKALCVQELNLEP